MIVLFSPTVHAQSSPYPKMTAVGDWQDWNPWPANMTLVSNNSWQLDLFLFTAEWTRFKFVANEDWGQPNWGDQNQVPPFQAPVTGTAEVISGGGNDIWYTNIQYGWHRLTFNDNTRYYRIQYLRPVDPTNLLRNAGFETAGSWDGEAQYWQWNVLDHHGSKGGGTERHNWRAHSGHWEAAIHGKWWWDSPDWGMWWQEGEGEPGLTYLASAWFWADQVSPNGPWTSTVQELKLEFYSTNYTPLAVFATNFPEVGTDIVGSNYVYKYVHGQAPPRTRYVRVVVYAGGVCTNGALQFDDIELRVMPTRQQDFNHWIAYTNEDCHNRDDWMVCTGKVTETDARSGYAASLPNPGGVTTNGNVIRSPRFEDGIGMISFWYRHGHEDTNSEPEEPVAFAVQKSPDGTNWTTIGTVTNILTLPYVNYTLFQYEPTPYFVRIQHMGGTNRLLIDDIWIREPESTRRYQDFNDWPDDGTNLGCHSYIDWQVCTGRIWASGAKEGKSADVAGSATFSNYVRSPFLSNGYGGITFYYARGTNGSTPANLALQASTDGSTWDTLDSVSNIISTSYEFYDRFFYETVGSYVRVINVVDTNVETTTIFIDEGFNDAPTPPGGWTFDHVTSTYTGSGNYGRDPPSLKFDSDLDSISTPQLVSPTNLQFWYRKSSADASSSLLIETTTNDVTWVTLANMTNLSVTATTVTYPLSTDVVRIKFSYTKDAQNLCFDDVIIWSSPAEAGAGQHLMLDQINIADPELYRCQDFDEWPTQSSYGNSTFRGWAVVDALIDPEKAYFGQVCRLNKTVGTHPHIQSSRLPGGIGTISFQYARYSASGSPDPVYLIQVSSNAADWTTIDTITVTVDQTDYQAYSKYRYDTTNEYVRIWHTSGSGQAVLFDEICIDEPTPAADVSLSAEHDPSSPYTNDWVSIWADAIPRYGAIDLVVTTLYRIGTSGVFHPIDMAETGIFRYVTISNIPPQPPGTTVQYFVRCDFAGPGSESTSPRFYPADGSNDPAYYRIPRNQSGAVWINEINFLTSWIDTNSWIWTDDTNEFIELAGVAGTDITDWQVALIYGSGTNYRECYAAYTLSNNTIFADETNGFGFFVIGDDEILEGVDRLFTNSASPGVYEEDNFADGYPDTLILYDEVGNVVQALAYNGAVPGFEYIPLHKDNFHEPYLSFSLTGTGRVFGAFTWTLTNMTPGIINIGQSFGAAPTNPSPPEIWITSILTGTNVTLVACGNTSQWNLGVLYTTNLVATPQTWLATPCSTNFADGTNTIWFNYPVGGVNCMFEVQATRP